MAESDKGLEDQTDTEHKQSPLAQKTTPETGERLKKPEDKAPHHIISP